MKRAAIIINCDRAEWHRKRNQFIAETFFAILGALFALWLWSR